MIKTVLAANCSQIASDQSNINATDVTITSAADDSYLDIYPYEIVEKLLDFSDTGKDKWYFAIWEDRIPYLFMRDASSLDWIITLGDLARMRLRHRGGDMWNSCYAIYQSSGTLTRTATADDSDSQTEYGVTRRKVIPDLGEVSATAAQAYRDGWLEDHKDVWPQLEEITIGDKVYNTSGITYPSFWVRAGEVIRIRDLVPATEDLTTIQRDALRTFYIVETQYDVEKGQLAIKVDTDNPRIDAVLARKLR